MLIEIKEKNLKAGILRKAFFGLVLAFALIVPAIGQTIENAQATTTKIAEVKSQTTVPMPVFTDYNGVKIGMTAEEVRDKLGKAKIDDKDGLFYDSEDKMVQIRLDADKKVQLVAVTFMEESESTPKYADVFGAKTQAPVQADGSIYNLVRYPEAGYWVAYSRTAGDKPTITVTMQKLR